jgi:hypothetical protein
VQSSCWQTYFHLHALSVVRKCIKYIKRMTEPWRASPKLQGLSFNYPYQQTNMICLTLIILSILSTTFAVWQDTSRKTHHKHEKSNNFSVYSMLKWKS